MSLWIPPEAVLEKPEKRYRCLNCGTDFPGTQFTKYKRHVTLCVRQHPEAIEKHVHDTNSNVFTGIADKEQYEWVRRRAAQGLKATKGGRAA